MAGGLDGGGVLDDVVTALIDGRGTVLTWSAAAAELTGRSASEVCGRPLAEQLAGTESDGPPADGPLHLRGPTGEAVPVYCRLLPLDRPPAGGHRLLLAVRTDLAQELEQGAALLRALLAQDRIGFVLRDTDLVVERTNASPDLPSLRGMPTLPVGSTLGDVMAEPDADTSEHILRALLETGRPQAAHEQRVRSVTEPGLEWSFLVSAVRLDDRHGKPAGTAALLTDATAQWRAARRLELRHRAVAGIGVSLDVTTTAREIANVLAPAFADLVTVDLAEPVLTGDEPPKTSGGGDLHLRRAAMHSAGEIGPPGDLRTGDAIPLLPDRPQVRRLQAGHTVVLGRAELLEGLQDPELIRLIVPERAHCLAVAPLFARGLVLGTIAAWRINRTDRFDSGDSALLAEIAAHASLSVDNARRYAREHRAAVALQQRLLPRSATRTSVLETVGRYLPAADGGEIGGDWFDTILLPSLRVALVVGDVIGHGLHAAATMGRLRTAVQTLADLELPPDELLTRLDDLVARLAAEADPAHRDTIGATCLLALYDPVTRQCTLASAGHPPPVVAEPGGTARPLPVRPGPLLGVGGLPFETTTVELAPGSLLALYTDGLLVRQGGDLDSAVRTLEGRLGRLAASGQSLDAVGRELITGPGAATVADDTALLLARTSALDPDAVAEWQFPADPATVADARAAVAARLSAWGLDDLAFTTELIVSELVTNAIRYAGGPVGLRLILDTVLICEVSDPSNTQPRLRRARVTDEGGRGLFLVAQLSHRWGSRYGPTGKTIWSEQQLEA
ncbi:serine phosphatase RsbU (regulator of sigma subunit) [Streptomyces sp. TLI_235]|nr:SpoIIE family protein phosphatase [Streptomyces sp. TLI_235]PBC67402.1 serine phosphatase RsbU (regulator of sigma subunit) [Streptomyces sp. TLI_235]